MPESHVTMPKRVFAVASLVVSVGLAIWAFSLFWTESEISYDKLEVECSSVYAVGAGNYSEPDDAASNGKFSWEPGDPISGHVSDEIADDCQDKRTATTGQMSLILTPAAFLAMLSVHLFLKDRHRDD